MVLNHQPAGTPADSYPLFGLTVPGKLHLRCYPVAAGDSRQADLCAIAAERLEAGDQVLQLTSDANLSSVIAMTGYGWRHPNYRVVNGTDLLAATAALYRAWHEKPATPLTVIIDDIQDLDTGIGSGHDDSTMTNWIQCALAANLDGLAEISGLHWAHYIRTPEDPQELPMIIAGTRRRHAGELMGGHALAYVSSSTVEILEPALGAADTVTATAHVVKHMLGRADTTVGIVRALRRNQTRDAQTYWTLAR